MADLFPGPVDRAEEFALTVAVFNQTLVEVNGPFLGFYDVKQGYLLGCFRQVKPTPDPPLGTDNALLDQGLEYFGKKGRRDILCFTDIFLVDDFSGRLTGHVEYGTDGVFCCAGNNQNRFLLPIFLTIFVIK